MLLGWTSGLWTQNPNCPQLQADKPLYGTHWSQDMSLPSSVKLQCLHTSAQGQSVARWGRLARGEQEWGVQSWHAAEWILGFLFFCRNQSCSPPHTHTHWRVSSYSAVIGGLQHENPKLLPETDFSSPSSVHSPSWSHFMNCETGGKKLKSSIHFFPLSTSNNMCSSGTPGLWILPSLVMRHIEVHSSAKMTAAIDTWNCTHCSFMNQTLGTYSILNA